MLISDRDDDDDEFGDDACGECALPCLFLLGPAAVFLVLGLGALNGWAHETGSTRLAALAELQSAVARWEKHRPLLAGLRLTANLSVPGLEVQVVEFTPTSAAEGVPPSAKDAPTWAPLRFEASLPPLTRAWRHPLTADLRFAASWPIAHTRTPLTTRAHAFSLNHVELTQLHVSRASNLKECVHQRKGAWRAGNCSVARVLGALCFAVDVDAAAGAVTPRGLGKSTFGCRMEGRRWHALTHRTVPSTRARAEAATAPSSKAVAASSGLKLTRHGKVLPLLHLLRASSQRPSSAPAPPQGAPGGPVQLGTPRVRPSHRGPSHGLGGSSERPPKDARRCHRLRPSG